MDAREYKDCELYMNRNRSGIKLHGLDTGGKVKGGMMKQEAADTKYSIEHKESNVRKKLNHWNTKCGKPKYAERDLRIRAVGLVESCGR